MVVYGVALLAGCFIAGQIIGLMFGRILDIDANVGGVGFAMLLLIFLQQWMNKKNWYNPEMISGINFWNKMYIPVIVAMSATQNVKAAFSSGMVAVLSGILPTVICFLLIPAMVKITKKKQTSL